MRRRVATTATTGGSTITTEIQAGAGPLSGSAASSGNSGSAPIETPDGETSVPTPTVKPGPSR